MKKPTRIQMLAGAGAFVVLILVCWFAWPASNPLLGKWVAIDKDTDPFRVSVTLIGQLEFLPDAVIVAGESHPASYSVSRDSVIVMIKPSFGEGMIHERYTVHHTLAGLRIQRQLSFMPDGTVDYRKL